MTRRLHSVTLPETQQPREPRQQQTAQAITELIGESQPAVESVASQAADLTLSGSLAFRADVAAKLRREIRQLPANQLGHLGLRRVGDEFDENRGYYSVTDAEVTPAHAAGGEVAEYTISLNRQGTPSSHVVFCQPTPRDVFTPYASSGSGDPPFIIRGTFNSLLAEFKPATGEVSPVSNPNVISDHANAGALTLTVSDLPSGDRPGVVGAPALSRDGRLDVRVWDDRDNFDKFDPAGAVQWLKVLDSSHEFEGSAVISDGRVRVRLKLDNNSPVSETVTVEQYSSGNWSLATTTATTTPLDDFDLSAIRRTFVEAVFEDSGSTPYRLRVVRDGDPEFYFLRDQPGTSPRGIENSIKSAAVTDRARIPAVTERLLPRSEVRTTDR